MSDYEAIRLAREAVSRGDWAIARERYRTAGRLPTRDLAALADACWWLGLPEESVEVNSELHRRYRDEGERARAALVALETGFDEMVRGRPESAGAWLARARRLLEGVPDSAEAGYLCAFDAEEATAAGDLDVAEDMAGRVLELAERHRSPTLLALGLFHVGVLALRRGRTDEGMRRLDEAMLPLQEPGAHPMWAGYLYCRMIDLCHEMADHPRAQHWTTLTEQWCHGYAPAVLFQGTCRVHRVQLMQVRGDWTLAEAEARRAAEDLADLDVLVCGEAHYRIGEVDRLRGDLDEARSAYQRAHEFGRDPLPGLALLHLRQGRGRVAASVLDAALAAERSPLRRAPLLAGRIEVALAGPDPHRASRYVDELATIAEQYASPGWRAEVCRWRGASLLARRRDADAVRVLREARALWQRIGAPYQVARIRIDLATAYDALGDQDSARREREEAVSALESLGARPEADRLKTVLGRHHAPDDLSARELEVVAAIAGGDTNREAARGLHISERTVARHLANAYLKAGVSSRTGLVAWARDRGLL
jgi:DNA-binding CsgD family transcriptional regulator